MPKDKPIPTENLYEDLIKADERLHTIISQMKVYNDIRSKLEDGYDAEALLSEIRDSLKIAVDTKENTLKDIKQLHLKLAERHMKLTEDWEFVYIGERNVKK